MNNPSHPFDPSLRPFFSESAYLASKPYRQGSREMFHVLMHLSEHDAVYPAAYEFIRGQLAEDRILVPGLHFEAKGKAQHKNNLSQRFPAVGSLQLNDKNLQHYLLQLSPVILTEPCWLHAISQASTSQNPLAVDLTAVYLTLTRGDTCKNMFHALLLASSLALPPLKSRLFAQQKGISDCLFDFAATQLALACFPRVFFPEILGFTMAYCESPDLLESVQTVDVHPDLARYANFSQCLRHSTLPAVNQIIEDYLNDFLDQGEKLQVRIQSGYRLYKYHAEKCFYHLRRQLQNPPSPSDRWLQLVKNKAPYAWGHHRKITLAGRSLDDWFAESPFDGQGFLSALKQSPYFDHAHPANSPLLKLFNFNGPMFGVLNDEERKILENWLADESDAGLTETPDILENTSYSGQRDEGCGPTIDFSSLNNRELYYYLVNAELYPEVLAKARIKIHKVLRSAGCLNRLPFTPYHHRAFECYVDALYQREVRNYKPVESKPKLSKEAYLWGIEQMAPAILADGCWLQNIRQLSYDSDRVLGTLLYKIYEDETGNGKLEQNHPFIYQQLLSSVNLSLPPITSRQFAEHPGFIDSAFDLPVYLLSISKFPCAFLPELLGLNMAIELSGLGNLYLRLSEELTFWGINPAIVDVHISIDNLSSGHAYLAKNAIELYLDQVDAGFGKDAVQSHWRRIFNGYCSLQSVCREFTLALVCRYFFKRMTKRLSLPLTL